MEKMLGMSMKLILVSFSLLLSTVCLGHENSTTKENNDNFIINLLWDCTKSDDMGICIKTKAINYLDNLVRTKEPFVINEYLSLVRDREIPETVDQDLNKSEPDVENTSTEEEQEKNEELDGIIWGKLSSLFRTRTVQLSVSPQAFQGRDKEGKIFKKGHGIFLMAAMMGGMMMKMALGKIALIAGKALLIGKIALVLTLIISLKKFLGHSGGGGGGHPEIVYASSEHGGRSWQRNFRMDPKWSEGGGDLAYNAHRSFK